MVNKILFNPDTLSFLCYASPTWESIIFCAFCWFLSRLFSPLLHIFFFGHFESLQVEEEVQVDCVGCLNWKIFYDLELDCWFKISWSFFSSFGYLPGWNTSYLSLVTTSDTKFESAFAKKGTEATNDLVFPSLLLDICCCSNFFYDDGGALMISCEKWCEMWDESKQLKSCHESPIKAVW